MNRVCQAVVNASSMFSLMDRAPIVYAAHSGSSFSIKQGMVKKRN